MKNLIVLLILLLSVPRILSAASFPTVCHTELSSWIKTGQSLAIIDIQNLDDFRLHSYERSYATANNSGRIKKIARRLRAQKDRVVVVSGRGGSDAVRAAEMLAAHGIARSRIMLLEGGIQSSVKNVTCECCKPASLSGSVQ